MGTSKNIQDVTAIMGTACAAIHAISDDRTLATMLMGALTSSQAVAGLQALREHNESVGDVEGVRCIRLLQAAVAECGRKAGATATAYADVAGRAN